MRAKHLTYWVVGAALGAATLFDGSAAASDYPPRDTSVTTVPSGGGRSDPPNASSTSGQLPATGADADTTMKVAGGALVTGAGLLVATKLRRRPAAG